MQNIDLSFKLLMLHQRRMHLIKKLKKYSLKLKTKSWLTADIQNSIKIKNKTF